jgi:mannitol-1-phosphate 5-dehydrogenase
MTAAPKTFVGFGFGAIQGGLFLYEAFRSGKFTRLVVAEVVPDVVAAVRRAEGCFRVNIATRTGIVVQEVRGVEILNPTVPADARALAEALAEASEIATALPSVDFFQRGEPTVAGLIAGAIQAKLARKDLPPAIVYTGENNNHAAEILQKLCDQQLDEPGRAEAPRRVQFLNTVIGKMSGVVTAPEEIKAEGLACLVEGSPRALLVEEFNRILITQIRLPGFQRGIEVFVEKPDLLPFEEAKLYGHNAVHALIGYLAARNGCRFMSEAASDQSLMQLAGEAFLAESGAALIAKHHGLDPLFTPSGYRLYADDLLERMTNPYLRDRTERVIRDTPRKLSWDDRLIGTMRLALDAGVTPHRFALGAAAALETLPVDPVGTRSTASVTLPDENGTRWNASLPGPALSALWPAADDPPGRKSQLIHLITEAQAKLKSKQS